MIVRDGNTVIANPMPSTLTALGYLPVVEEEMPEFADNEYLTPRYHIVDGKIVVSWVKEAMPAVTEMEETL